MSKRSIHFLVLATAVLTAVGIVPALAGTTGKLQGRVVDEKNQPLAGANVRIEGLRLGALTDENGSYVIVGVPGGVQVVRVNLLGYAPFAAERVVVTPDFTTTLNATLKTEAVQMGEVHVEATRPLLQRDATGTTRVLSSDDIQKLPTRGYRDAAAQQTGVVNFRRQIDAESQGQNTLIVRGGRPNEVAYYVDGFSQQDPLTGTSSTSINNDAIQEVVLMTGGFNAEYGRIMSGAVNVITREGKNNYFGSLEAVSDALSGNWLKAPQTDYNLYDGSLGGPVLPGVENLTFYLSGERRWLRDRYSTYHSPVLNQQLEAFGLDTDITPYNSSLGWTTQGKIAWEATDHQTVKLGALLSEEDWREFSNAYLFDLAHTPRYLDRNQSYNATYNHVLSSKAFWNLGVNYFQTSRKRGDGIAFDNLNDYKIASNPRFDQDIPMFYDEGHIVNNYLQRAASYWGTQAGFTSQISSHNQLKLGGDYQRHTLRYLQHYLPTTQPGTSAFDSNWDGYGYDLVYHRDSTGEVTRVDIVENGDDSQDGPKHPQVWSLFAQDKFEREGVVVNAGLRYDYIDPATAALKNDLRPLEDGPYPDSLDAADLGPNKVYSRVSPRLGILFPLDEKTLLRFNYGKFFQQPNLQDLYPSYRFLEYKLNTGGYFVPFGNPNLKPERTTAYEVGMQRQISDHIRLDVTAYYKDVKDLVEITNIPSSPKSFTTFRNRDFATVKGIDVGFAMRPKHRVSGSVNYSLSYAQGTGSVSQTQRNVAWLASEPPKQTAPLDFDQRHKLSFNFDLSTGKGDGPLWNDWRLFENVGVNVLYNVASGTPYTPTQPYNELTLAAVSSLLSGPLNSRYGPWTQSLDVKASKGFGFTGMSMSAFVWVLNVFNTRNAYTVYSSTGSPETTGWLNTNPGQAYLANAAANGKDGRGMYELAEADPSKFGNPRLVRFGIRTGF